MSKSGEEKRDLVFQMVIDQRDIWDLDTEDKEALRHVLGMVNVMADMLAAYMGCTVIDSPAVGQWVSESSGFDSRPSFLYGLFSAKWNNGRLA